MSISSEGAAVPPSARRAIGRTKMVALVSFAAGAAIVLGLVHPLSASGEPASRDVVLRPNDILTFSGLKWECLYTTKGYVYCTSGSGSALSEAWPTVSLKSSRTVTVYSRRKPTGSGSFYDFRR
jgi:hypothetical protein